MTLPFPTDPVQFGSTLNSDVSALVYIKAKWSDEWVYSDQLVCTSVTWAASPNCGSASLEYRYGPTSERNGTQTIRAALDIDGYFVRIVVNCGDAVRYWYGFVVDTGEDSIGVVKTVVSMVLTSVPTGRQFFQCLGILAAFDRDPIQQAFIFDSDVTSTDGWEDARWADSAPWFNQTADLLTGQKAQIKSRKEVDAEDPDPEEPTTYIFGWRDYIATNTDVEYWSRRNIVKYLIQFAKPRNEAGGFSFNIRLESENQIPDFGRPELDCDGMTLKQALDAVLSSEAGLGYFLYVDESTSDLVIKAFSYLDTSLTVSETPSEILLANDKQVDIFIGNDPASSFTLQRSLTSRYNQIVCRGARRVSVLSRKFNVLQGFFYGWSTTDVTNWQTEFPLGVSINPAEDTFRRLDGLEQSKYHHIYRNFPLNLTGLLKYPVPSQPLQNTFHLDGSTSRYVPSRSHLLILPRLPLKQGVDYSLETSPDLHESTVRPFRKIEIYGRAHSLDSFSSSPPHSGPPLDWTKRAFRDIQYHKNQPNYRLSAEAYENETQIGLEINVDGGPQTVMGGGGGLYQPGINPEALEATIAVQEDRYCEAKYPPDSLLPDGLDTVLRKVIDFGDKYQLVELVKTTIVAVTQTDFVKVPETIYIRDDREQLEKFARQYYRWYAGVRRVMRLTSRRVTAMLWPGYLINQINPGEGSIQRAVNTVITEVTLNLPIGQGDSTEANFSFVTSRGDLDFMQYRPRLPS